MYTGINYVECPQNLAQTLKTRPNYKLAPTIIVTRPGDFTKLGRVCGWGDF